MNRKTMAQKKSELMEDPAFKVAYESKEIMFSIAMEAIKARKEAHLTQTDVAQAMETKQSTIARLESGRAVPTLKTLDKFAKATGKRLRISFEPVC